MALGGVPGGCACTVAPLHGVGRSDVRRTRRPHPIPSSSPSLPLPDHVRSQPAAAPASGFPSAPGTVPTPGGHMGFLAQLLDGAVRSAYSQGAARLPPPVLPHMMLVRGTCTCTCICVCVRTCVLSQLLWCWTSHVLMAASTPPPPLPRLPATPPPSASPCLPRACKASEVREQLLQATSLLKSASSPESGPPIHNDPFPMCLYPPPPAWLPLQALASPNSPPCCKGPSSRRTPKGWLACP